MSTDASEERPHVVEVVFCCLLLAACAAPQPRDIRIDSDCAMPYDAWFQTRMRVSVGHPSDWVLPDGAALERYYPPAAAERIVSGKASLECQVGSAGELETCRVLSEAPEKYAFGIFAIRATKRLKVNAARLEARRGTTETLTFTFQARGKAPGPPYVPCGRQKDHKLEPWT